MKSVNKLVCKLFFDGKSGDELNCRPVQRGENTNTLHRAFYPSERYIVDFADDFTKEGWVQFDCDQDASYFGIWVCPQNLGVLTYCEGDWTYESCISVEDYNAAIQALCDFYDEGFVAKAMDTDGNWEVFRQDRKQFFVPIEESA